MSKKLINKEEKLLRKYKPHHLQWNTDHLFSRKDPRHSRPQHWKETAVHYKLGGGGGTICFRQQRGTKVLRSLVKDFT